MRDSARQSGCESPSYHALRRYRTGLRLRGAPFKTSYTMKTVCCFLMLCCLPALRAAAQGAPPPTPFVRASFDRVIITEVDYTNPEADDLPRGWALGRPLPPAFVHAPDDTDRATLTPAEADTLTRRLLSPKSYRHGASICFAPRLHLYFLKADTLVNHVAVCIECNRLRSDHPIKAAEWPKDSLNPKVLSVAMRRWITRLIARHGFAHGADGSSVWDEE